MVAPGDRAWYVRAEGSDLADGHGPPRPASDRRATGGRAAEGLSVRRTRALVLGADEPPRRARLAPIRLNWRSACNAASSSNHRCPRRPVCMGPCCPSPAAAPGAGGGPVHVLGASDTWASPDRRTLNSGKRWLHVRPRAADRRGQRLAARGRPRPRPRRRHVEPSLPRVQRAPARGDAHVSLARVHGLGRPPAAGAAAGEGRRRPDPGPARRGHRWDEDAVKRYAA